MKNILFVYGYGSSPNGNTANNLRELLGGIYNIHCFDYKQENATTAITNLNHYIRQHNIDLVIGSSLGGFLTLNLVNVPKIVVNPCLSPSSVLPNIGAPKSLVETYEKYEGNFNRSNNTNVVGFFGTHDEVLGRRYVNFFHDNISTKYFDVNMGHHIDKDVLINDIIPQIKAML